MRDHRGRAGRFGRRTRDGAGIKGRPSLAGGRRMKAIILLLTAFAAVFVQAGPAHADVKGYQVRNTWFTTEDHAPCLSTLAHPATWINSALVTVACAEDISTPPPPPRQIWNFGNPGGVGGSGYEEISSAMPDHDGLCATEYLATHIVRLEVCPSSTNNPKSHQAGWWHRVIYTNPEGER